MKLKPKNKLVEHFGEIEDPRIERSQRHKLSWIITSVRSGISFTTTTLSAFVTSSLLVDDYQHLKPGRWVTSLG